ncbi:hypothetical protein HN51_069741, partial [Arachis hypogaea]
DGTYAMKKVLIKSNEQLELVREEIHVSSLFNHPNLLSLLDHAIISVKVSSYSNSQHPLLSESYQKYEFIKTRK